MNKVNLAVFGSTNGTDLQAIIGEKKASRLAYIDLKFVLSDKKDSGILKRASGAGYKTIFLDPKGKKKKEFDEECLRLCQEHKIGLILLIGYMRIITQALITPYKNRIINIHPSLLPKYPGMDLDVHKAVLDAHEKQTGATLHFIDEGVDTGPIILQAKVPIEPGETPETLKPKVQAKEQEIIIEGLIRFAGGDISDLVFKNKNFNT